MSVAATIALVSQRPLVQTSDLDPQRLFLWTGSVTADGSGGTLSGTCLIPTGFAACICAISAQVAGGGSSDVMYTLNEDGATILIHGVQAFDMNSTMRAPSWTPPLILLTGDTISSAALADNVTGDDMSVFAIGFGWDQQFARNLPQKFFWPGTLG